MPDGSLEFASSHHQYERKHKHKHKQRPSTANFIQQKNSSPRKAWARQRPTPFTPMLLIHALPNPACYLQA
jgi:hypothetical protein